MIAGFVPFGEETQGKNSFIDKMADMALAQKNLSLDVMKRWFTCVPLLESKFWNECICASE